MADKFSVLFVDDEEYNLIPFRATFRKDYTIFTAKSGKEALKILRNENIGLIITDQRMPEMTGVELLEQIVPEFPDVIRIILTGFSDVEAIINAINNGQVFRYITKPWDEVELKMTIENARRIFGLQLKNNQLIEQMQQKVVEQEKMLKLFQKYVPEVVVEETLKQGGSPIFEGETRYVAVLFSDLRGFTPMTENMNPRDVVAFLNNYYSIMSNIIKRHYGNVMQFVGDEIFASFGAPVAHPDPEKDAVYCALEMMENLEKLQEVSGQKISMGIGINAGEVITGNLGSEDRINYCATGDTVNTGKRIEMLTKSLDNTIYISDPVFQVVKDMVDAEPIPPQLVKGKKDPIHVYKLLSRKVVAKV